ncbi:hypothetical protein IGI80_001332 [Enterococcus sp. DIV1420a]
MRSPFFAIFLMFLLSGIFLILFIYTNDLIGAGIAAVNFLIYFYLLTLFDE